MSRIFNGAFNLKNLADDLGITAFPASVLVWAKISDTAAGTELLFRYYNASSKQLDCYIDNTGTLVASAVEVSTHQASSNNHYDDSAWHPLIFLYDVDYVSIRTLSETRETTLSNSYSNNSSPKIYIGSTSTPTAYLSGRMAYFAVWKSHLASQDITDLLNGANPTTIDASNLTRAWDFRTYNGGADLTDVKNSVVLTATGTTNYDDSDNPTITGGFTPGPGTTPKEGRALIANLVYKNADANRGTSLQLGLLTNSTVLDENTTLDQITEPTSANGYARITLTDANWTVSVPDITYALQQFTASGGSFSAAIYGWFICTTGTAPKLLHFQQSSGAPYTITDGMSVNVPLDTTI